MGDSIMVIFRACYRSDHALQAVRAAADMAKKIRALQDQWANMDFPDLRMEAGLPARPGGRRHGGDHARLDYAAIGATTNTAAKLQPSIRRGAGILISSETYRDLPTQDQQSLGCADLGKAVMLPGKKQPLILHQVSVA